MDSGFLENILLKKDILVGQRASKFLNRFLAVTTRNALADSLLDAEHLIY